MLKKRNNAFQNAFVRLFGVETLSLALLRLLWRWNAVFKRCHAFFVLLRVINK